MIRDAIDTINDRIRTQLTTDAVMVGGMAIVFQDQQEKATSLRLVDEDRRLTLDGSLRWQSAHLSEGSRVVNSRTFGTFTDHVHEVRFVLMGVSKAQSGKDVAMRALDGVSYVVIDDVDDETLSVLKRYWQVKTGPDKNYDPALFAFAIRYHIEGVQDEDLTELPDENDLAQLPVLLAEPETVVVQAPGNDSGVPRSHRHIQALPASTWTVVHNMGCYPGGIVVEDTGGNDWQGTVSYIDTNTLTIGFGMASFAGTAYIS